MIDLAAAKQHCRVDHDDDDMSLMSMIAAAADHLESIGVDIARDHPAVDQAMLMLVAHFYGNREAMVLGTIATEIKFGVDRLIQPYREISL